MKTRGSPRIRVVLKAKRGARSTLQYAKAVLAAFSANPTMFPAPTITLKELAKDIAALDAAEATTLTNTKVAFADRDAKFLVVKSDLELLRGYVQRLADQQPDNVLVLAEAAGMSTTGPRRSTKNSFAAKPGKVSGTVQLSVRKTTPYRESHCWAYSLDGGKTWIDLPNTLQAKTLVRNLPPGATVWFRHMSITKAGPGDWCAPISIVVR